MNEQCTDLFKDVFDSGSSGCRRECHCGITHFNDDEREWDWEDGELELLKKKRN